jgi:predicted protein tyrosine phosphatase
MKFLNDSEIYVCGVSRATKLLMSTETRGDIDACISIADPYGGKRPPKDGFYSIPYRLTLSFDDALEDSPSGNHVVAPSINDVEMILDFDRKTRRHIRPGKRFLIHCHAGISRSTATALAILADRLGPGFEKEAVECLVRATEDNEPWPNATLVAHADALLGRGGRLCEAAGELYRLGALLVGVAAQKALDDVTGD